MKSNVDGRKSTKLNDSSPSTSLRIPSKVLSAGCHCQTSANPKKHRDSGKRTKLQYPIRYKKLDISLRSVSFSSKRSKWNCRIMLVSKNNTGRSSMPHISNQQICSLFSHKNELFLCPERATPPNRTSTVTRTTSDRFLLLKQSFSMLKVYPLTIPNAACCIT